MQPSNLKGRQNVAKIGRAGLFLSLMFSLLALVVLFATIIEKTAGYTVTEFAVDPASIASKPLAELDSPQLARVLQDNLSSGAFDNTVVEELNKLDQNRRTEIVNRLLQSPAESTVSDVPLADLGTLEIVQTLIEERLGPERVQTMLDERLASVDKTALEDFIRTQFLQPVSESDLTGGRDIAALELDELLTIINERFGEQQLAKYDLSELANEEQSKIIEVIRTELVGQADESALLGKPLADATRDELADYLRGRFAEETYRAQKNLFVAETTSQEDLVRIVRQDLLQPVDPAVFSPGKPIDQLSSAEIVAQARATLDADRQNQLFAGLLAPIGREGIIARINNDVLLPSVAQSWGLFESLLNKSRVEREAAQKYPGTPLVWRNWITGDFLGNVMSSRAELSGIRTALLGSLWLLVLTIGIALPIGVGAAIYLEELAGKSRLSAFVQLNIYNLAGIPSIIYGMLGLTIFVRTLGDLMGITSGAVFGVNDSNGRTILSAALTMALLILPLIIVNAQEALRAVPSTLREAAYGIGLTKLQTIWHYVLPSALPGILTGAILAMSRAIGETAPLIVIGASTFIAVDPSGPFSKFTALPIQIYKWTTLPDATFLNVSAAAIVVLLAVLVSLNMSAILLRNRFRKQL